MEEKDLCIILPYLLRYFGLFSHGDCCIVHTCLDRTCERKTLIHAISEPLKFGKSFRLLASLRSRQDFARDCFCLGNEAVDASGEAVRELVKSRIPSQAKEI